MKTAECELQNRTFVEQLNSDDHELRTRMMWAASAAVPVGRAHHRALQSGGDAAASIIQSRQIEKFKIAAKLEWSSRFTVGRVGPGSDGRPRIETQELSPSLSVVIQAVSLSRFLPWSQVWCQGSTRVHCRAITPFYYRYDSAVIPGPGGLIRHGEARCREEIAYYRNVEEVSLSL
jgi:hypothetical protein